MDYGILGSEEKCCASVLLRMGDPEHKRVFQENIDLFNSLGIDTLISSCSGCFKTILQDYPRVAPLRFEVLHTVEYLARLLKQGKLAFPHPVNRTVTYHDPCHLGRATGGFEAPRTILKAIPGLRLVEMPRNRDYSRCCGAGGGLKAGFPEIQNKMAQRRIREAEDTGAEQLVSCCPFCFQGLNIGITGLASPMVMRDLSSLVAESLLGYDVFENPAEKTRVETSSESGPAGPAATPVARQTEREAKRAARRAARTPVEMNAPIPPEPPPPSADPINEAPDAGRAEKERQRAEKRAARRAARTPDGCGAGPVRAGLGRLARIRSTRNKRPRRQVRQGGAARGEAGGPARPPRPRGS